MPYIEICILSHFSIYFSLSLYIYTHSSVYMPLNHLRNFHGKTTNHDISWLSPFMKNHHLSDFSDGETIILYVS